MGVKFYKEPKLRSPTLVACWPGIGNIGIIAVDILKLALRAEEFAEIEGWEFFYPKRVVIKDSLLRALEFPFSKFYFKKADDADLIIFMGEEQPAHSGAYAEGQTALDMANLVLDVAEKFGCRRVFTSGAAVAPIHHSMQSRVWAVPNSEDLIGEITGRKNILLMSDIEGRGGQGNITGLNGLLLGLAGKRGIKGMCLMGEIPAYIQGFPVPYPKASQAVLEALTGILGVTIDMESMAGLVRRSEEEVEKLYQSFPEEIRVELDKLTRLAYARQEQITEEDKKRILEDIDKFFKTKPKEEQT